VAKLQAEVQTVIEQRKQAKAFLKKIERHLDVIEIDEDDACCTITPTKLPTKRRRTE
jgi:chaperonin cofactor prefoldin